MKRFYFLGLLLLIVSSTVAQSGISLEIYAGSNAPWGESQYISIDTKGNVFYTLNEVGEGIKDSLRFKLTQSQLTDLGKVLNTAKFFQLQPKHNEQSRDGMRLSVLAMQSGKQHKVHWINVHTPESDQLANILTAILKPKNINLMY